jgi:hypothetical protein
MSNMLKTSALFMGFLLVCLAKADGQSANPCSDQSVHYEPPPQAVQKKIQLAKSVSLAEFPDSAKHNLSPQGTRWFVELDPDYTSTKAPWTTTLYIKSGPDGKSLLKASFIDHGNTFSASWINEKLLFVEVWWGRMASSDLILDVNQGTFIYDEFAHYGELFEPCH